MGRGEFSTIAWPTEWPIYREKVQTLLDSASFTYIKTYFLNQIKNPVLFDSLMVKLLTGLSYIIWLDVFNKFMQPASMNGTT